MNEQHCHPTLDDTDTGDQKLQKKSHLSEGIPNNERRSPKPARHGTVSWRSRTAMLLDRDSIP
jgi:hypothetical protein